MTDNVISLAKQLIEMPSVSQQSNAAISDFIQEWLTPLGFEFERVEYRDQNDVLKVNLIGKLGEGTGGLAFSSHSDTVPGQEADWPAFEARVEDGRLYGRGSCDMKGPLAATMMAVAAVDRTKLTCPLYMIVTSDEELGLYGAEHTAQHSKLLPKSRPQYSVIAEPTRLQPVYGHKGYAMVRATAYGKAAHTSTGKGVSANFQVAPFMAEMAELAKKFATDPQFMNDQFDPPTNGFNMIVNDGNTAFNVTADKSEVGLSFRVMPDTQADEVLAQIVARAKEHRLETWTNTCPPLYTSLDSDLVKAACELTGTSAPGVVSYSTDGAYLQSHIEDLVILGAGDIAQAHTVGEYVSIEQLEQSVDVYRQLIERLCM